MHQLCGQWAIRFSYLCYHSAMRRTFVKLLKLGGFAYLLLCLFMWGVQDTLIYQPSGSIQTPAAYGLHDFSEVTLQASDGTNLQSWYHPAHASFPTLVYFHGNGGHLGLRAPYFAQLDDAGFGILALSYRGYGKSGGTPSEEGFYRDARAALHYVVQQLSLKPSEILLYGESLGTGVAVQMATEFSVAGLILQSPYSSLDALAEHNYPWVPTRSLLHNHFNSIGKIAQIHAPLLLIHGEQDSIIPVQFARALFAKAPTPKQAHYLQGKGHNNLETEFLTNAIIDFCREQKLIAAP